MIPRLPAIAAASVVAAGLVLLAAPAQAAAPQPVPTAGKAVFGLGPASSTRPDGRSAFDYAATPGAGFADHVAVENIGTAPLTLRLYATDADSAPDGTVGFLPADHPPVDAGQWIRVATPTITVPGRSTRIVAVTTSVPDNASPGDHVAGIVASLQTVGTNPQGGRVRLDQRVVSRVYLRVSGPLRPSLRIEDVHLHFDNTANPFGGGDGTLTWTVRNTGNVRLGAAQTGTVADLFGHRTVPPTTVAQLLPGAVVSQRAHLSGIYPGFDEKASVRVAPVVLTGDRLDVATAVGTAHASAVPWALIAFVAAALVVLAALIVAGRRYRRRPTGRHGRGGPGGGPRRGGGPGPAPDRGGRRAEHLATLTVVHARVVRRSPGARLSLRARHDSSSRRVQLGIRTPQKGSGVRITHRLATLAGGVIVTASGILALAPAALAVAPGTGDNGGAIASVNVNDTVVTYSPTVTTSGGCLKTDGSEDYYYAVINGPGFATNDTYTAVTQAGISHSKGVGFSVAQRESLADLAEEAKYTFKGGEVYTVSVFCSDVFGDPSSSFTGTFTISSNAKTYHFAGPTTPATATTTTLTASPASPRVQGTSVTFTATVTGGTPVGSVAFYDGSTKIGTSTVSGGKASLATSSLSAATHSVKAVYTSSDGRTTGSTSAAISYVITAKPKAATTTTTLSVSPTSGVLTTTTVTLSASVAPAAAGGTVTFKDNGTAIGSAVGLSSGKATRSATFAAGTHKLTASFTPANSAAYAASTSGTTTLSVTKPTPQPSANLTAYRGATRLGADPALQPGQQVTLKVTGFVSGLPATVSSDGRTVGRTAAAGADGDLTYTYAVPATMAAGSHVLAITQDVAAAAATGNVVAAVPATASFPFEVATAGSTAPSSSAAPAPSSSPAGSVGATSGAPGATSAALTPGSLSHTGVDAVGLGTLAGVLLVAGLVLVVGARRRRGAHGRRV